MDDQTPQDVEVPEPPKDLRAELFQNLATQFAEALESNGSLPDAAQEALIKLLDSDAATAVQIISAAEKNDPEEKDADNE